MAQPEQSKDSSSFNDNCTNFIHQVSFYADMHERREFNCRKYSELLNLKFLSRWSVIWAKYSFFFLRCNTKTIVHLFFFVKINQNCKTLFFDEWIFILSLWNCSKLEIGKLIQKLRKIARKNWIIRVVFVGT